jgi:tetratricopeptide (TPR) repeat protein
MEHNLTSEEKEAWESFEVGSYEEVFEIKNQHPKSVFLQHLCFLCLWIQGEFQPENFQTSPVQSPSPLFHICQAVAYSLRYKLKEAWEAFKKHITQNSGLFCPSFIKLGSKIALENSEYEACLKIINLDPNPQREQFYAQEILTCLYNLKKFKEAIQHFKKNFQFIPESQNLYFIVGMSLLGLHKYKEAEVMLKKQTTLTLPTFEEKKQEFLEAIQNIPVLEKKPNLSTQELQDLGFAYLFTAQYKKAEEIFQKELALLTAKHG